MAAVIGRRLLAIAGTTCLAAVVVPAVVSLVDLDQVAQALALAGPAVGAAIAAATGRPLLAASALSGVGAYSSGLISQGGIPVPLAIVCGSLAGVGVGVLLGLAAARLDEPGFLLATLLLTLTGGAAILATPSVTGAQSGLGPLAALSLRLSGRDVGVLTPEGDFHVLLLVAAGQTALAVWLLSRPRGARWRAIGSDRARAASSGLAPLAGEVQALAMAGGLAALSGALSAHVARVAVPGVFGPDVAALPLLAALIARRRPLGAALIAIGVGIIGLVILPDAGWQGPPDAIDLALGALAALAVLVLFPTRRRSTEMGEPAIDAHSPWPIEGLRSVGSDLTVGPIRCAAPDGSPMLDAPAFSVAHGTVHGIVGPNGSGKSTLLREIVRRSGLRDGSVTVSARGAIRARVVVMPQSGGGFSACTVAETLLLAAQRGRDRPTARRLAAAWQERLGLTEAGNRLCSELSGGQRRLLDLARLLLGAPDVLLCDEPLAGLDRGHRIAAIACLREAVRCGLTVVIAEHDRAAISELADTLVELERSDLLQVASPA